MQIMRQRDAGTKMHKCLFKLSLKKCLRKKAAHNQTDPFDKCLK